MSITRFVITFNSKTRNRISTTVALWVLLLAAAAVCNAQTHTYVATTGDDNNPCTTMLPCRTFQGAYDKTSSGGEVVAIDTGIFGKKLTITKSITIAAAPGVKAGIAPLPTQAAVSISVREVGLVVLRNLYLDGRGSATRGIDFQTGGELHVENCIVSRFTEAGIYLDAKGGRAFVADTTVRNNGDGIFAFTNRILAPIDSVSIDRCRAEGNSLRGFFINGTKATIHDSVAAGNGTGFYCWTGVMNITGCVSINNGTGVFIESPVYYNSTARMAYSTMTGNQIGLYIGPTSTFYSLGNNLVHGNVTNVSGGVIQIIPGT